MSGASVQQEFLAAQFAQPADELAGDALRLEYRYGSRNWFANFYHQEIDPEFRADSGFIPRVDLKEDGLEMSHTWQGREDTWFNELRLGTRWNDSSDTSGQLLERSLQPFFSFSGPLQSFMQIGVGPREEFWNGQVYEMQGAFMFGQLRPRSGLNINMQVRRGEQIDYANSRLADQRRIQPTIDWNATRHLLVRLRYTSDRLSSKAGPTVFDAKLTDVRLTWQFNVRSFVRLTVQNQDIERNVDSYNNRLTDPSTSSRNSQLLYSYKLNPQTVLFAGYSNNFSEDDVTLALEETGRTLFFKLSYAWTP